MIRIMLVDDEPFIRVAIKSLFPWEDHGFSIVSEAGNGQEALDKLGHENIDLIITDIKMPVIDGITLIRQVKNIYPHIHCVVLSNYGDFDLTRRAFIEGAEDYLLKGSLNKESFSALVHRLQTSCFKNHIADAPSSFPAPAHGFEDKVAALQQLIQNGRKEDADRELTQVLDFGLPYVIVSLRMLPHNIDSAFSAPAPNTDLIKNTVFKIITELSEFKLYYYAVSIREYILIIYDQDSDEQIFYRRLKAFFSKLDANAGAYLNNFSVVGISRLRKALSEIHFSYEEADALSARIFYRDQSAQYYYSEESEELSRKNTVKKYVLSCIENIPFYIKEQNWNTLYSLFEGLILLLKDNCYPPHQGKRLVSNLEFLILSEISRRFEDNPAFLFDNESIYDSIMQSAHIDLLQKTIDRFFEDIEEACSSLSLLQSECSDIVRQAVLYLKDHYRDPEINLSAAAQAISVNPSYLSRIFHKETGRTFNSYLNFLRMQYAKHLLLKTNDSVSAISEKSGYSNSKYFINLFKKNEGQSPSSYRNSRGQTAQEEQI